MVLSSPAVADDTVYVGSEDENVYALSEGDTADDTMPGLSVGGVLAGLGGVAYLLQRRLGTTESNSQ